jgi:hypothetical protein
VPARLRVARRRRRELLYWRARGSWRASRTGAAPPATPCRPLQLHMWARHTAKHYNAKRPPGRHGSRP